MSYVLVGILFLVVAGAFVAYLVVTGSRQAGGSDRSPDDAGDAGAPGIGADETPFGDTSEHAGETTRAGETVGSQDAEHAGGTGAAVGTGTTGTRDEEAGPQGAGAPAPERRFQRDPGGGEAEARPFTDA